MGFIDRRETGFQINPPLHIVNQFWSQRQPDIPKSKRKLLLSAVREYRGEENIQQLSRALYLKTSLKAFSH